MARLCSILLCGLIVTACERPRQTVSIPDDIAYVVVAELDDEGQIARLSPLGAWTPGVTVVSRGAPYRLLGYTAEQLGPFGVTRTALPAEPLQVAVGCRTPLLPPPRIQLERVDDEWVSRTVDANLRLTAPFVENVCADLSLNQVEKWRIDERCSRVPFCAPRPSVVGRCAVSFSLEDCGGGRLEVSIGPTGEVCAEILDRTELCARRVESEGLAGFACTNECTIDLYRESRDVEPPFSVEYIDFANGELRTPTAERTALDVRAETFRRGYGQAMIGVGDRIVVASHHNDGGHCLGDNPQFIFIDPVTLRTSTVAAEPCMWSLAPFEQGFFGTHQPQRGVWMLSRFDGQGRTENTVALAFDGPGQGQWKPESLLVSLDGTRVIAIMTNLDEERPGAGIVVARTSDLTILRSETVAGSAASFGATITDDTLLITQMPTGDITRIDPVLGVSSATNIAVFDSTLLYRPLFIGDRILVGSGQNAGVYVIDERGLNQGISHPGRDIQQSVFALSPFTDDAYLAIGAEFDFNDGRQAVVTLFNTKGMRFQPGVWPIGPGIATDIVQRAGRTFLLMPWLGQIAVLEPQP